MFKLKLLILIANIICLGIGIYSKNHMLIVSSSLFILYLLWVCRRWKTISQKDHFVVRAKATNDIILFFIVILCLRLYNVQVINKDKYRKEIENQIQGIYNIRGDRGNIYDNMGRELAYNVNIYNVFVDPTRVANNESAMKAIKEIIVETKANKDYKKFMQEIKAEDKLGRRYKPFLKEVSERDNEKIIDIKKKYELINNEIFLKKESRRKYYKKELYQTIVGTVGFVGNNSDVTGTVGIEKEYENYLRGGEAKRKNIFSKNRNLMLPTAKEELPLNLNGKNIYLTIDRDIQYILNDEMKKHYEFTNSEEAYAVIIEPDTGKILATSVFNKKKNNYRNPVFQNQLEPGSIFKPIIVAGALQDGYVTKNSVFDIKDGRIQKYNHTIKEASKSTKGILTLPQVLEKSSNVAMVLISDRFNNATMEKYLESFGFYNKTGVDYPYEVKPYTTSSRRWDGLKKYTISFGQGIAVTPIQMAAAFSAIVNGGKLYKPYLVDRIENENGVVIRRNLPKQVGQPIDEKTSKQMREMLEGVVEIGGGKQARLEGYRIGGKTGTAQISGGKKGYIKDDYLTSFIGFFPADKPKYLGIIMFYKPQVSNEVRYGGLVAAPVFKEVIKRITMNKSIESSEIAQIETTVKQTKKDYVGKITTMPDLKGMSLREVMNIFKDENINIKIDGIGIVENQYPAPKENLENVKEIKIYLK
ncbi:penicillin-binding protein [Fusobacterium sp.]|uniref:penicillin-binding protein n=1 Tax=Fusobacterium sp. TaxID=68766 RepID=UPI00262FBF42|nr:penicillin-binding protein [Fusobacterium sp.]